MADFKFSIFLYLMAITLSCRIQGPSGKAESPFENMKTSGPTGVNYWQHFPMHPENYQAVEFQAEAVDSAGIIKVLLYVLENELYFDSENLPSKKVRDDLGGNPVKAWKFERPLDSIRLNYRYERGFPSHSNVEYLFRFYNANGQITDRFAAFDAGDSPWPADKILLYSTTRQPMKAKINICFFADTDFGSDWSLFREDLSNLVYRGYHRSNVIQDSKDKWAFYYTRHELDGAALAGRIGEPQEYPDFLTSNRIEGIDAFGLLHREPYSDHALLEENIYFMANNLFTAESYNLGTAIHETGHAVFKLSDEYEQCACFQTGSWANVFQTFSGCELFLQEYHLGHLECREVENWTGETWFTPEAQTFFKSEADCMRFNEKNQYSIDSCRTFYDEFGNKFSWAFLGTCIMHDDGDRQVKHFQEVCKTVIGQYYSKLAGGMRESDILSYNNFGPGQPVLRNIFGYEKVIAMELEGEAQRWKIGVQKVKMGIPTKSIVPRLDVALVFTNAEGRPMHTLPLENPNKILIEGQDSSLLERQKVSTKTYFSIPFDSSCVQAICRDLEEVGNRPRQVRVPGEEKMVFDISEAVREADEEFEEGRMLLLLKLKN